MPAKMTFGNMHYVLLKIYLYYYYAGLYYSYCPANILRHQDIFHAIVAQKCFKKGKFKVEGEKAGKILFYN